MSHLKISLILTLIITVSCNEPASVSNIQQISYDSNGTINCIRINGSNSSDPKQVIWFYPDGSIKTINKYTNSSKEQDIGFYQSGNINYINCLDTSKLNGHAFIFYGDGALSNHRFWKNNNIAGYSTNYYQDNIGTLKNICFYDDSGKLQSWREAGTHGFGISVSPVVDTSKK